MNLSSLNFSFIAIIFLFVALLGLNVFSDAPGGVYLAFAPACVWAVVLVLRGRRGK